MDDVLVEIGGKNTMPEFTENLRGASAGEERRFEVSIPKTRRRSGLPARLSLHGEGAIAQTEELARVQ